MNFLAETKELHYNFSRQDRLTVVVLLYEYCHDNVLGKFGLVFPKLTNVTIHMNSTHSENTR